MKKFWESLREHAKNIFDFENKKIIPLLKREELKSHQGARKFFLTKASQKLNNWKVRDHCHYIGKYIAQHIVLVI